MIDLLLRVENLSKTFPASGGLLRRRSPAVHAVDAVSFSLCRGKTLGLVGETGSGKSTIGRLILRLLDPTAGKIWFDGQDITKLSRTQARRLRRNVQMVFQDPYGSLDPRMKVGSIIAEPMQIHNLWHSKGQGQDRVAEIMQTVGLESAFADRYPHEFSGGQRQRIGIARAMGVTPKLLVLDEPVSALDVSIQAQIINLLRDLQRDTQLAFLFIAHDLAVVRHVSDYIAVLYLGKIVETGPRDAIYDTPQHPYTRALLSAVPIPDPIQAQQRERIVLHGEIGSATDLPSGCRFHPRCYKARLLGKQGEPDSVQVKDTYLPKMCIEHDPLLANASSEHKVACHYPERN